MGTKNESTRDEAARLDRQYTGDAVNARTSELKQDLERRTDTLERKYEDSGESKDRS